MVKFVLPEGGYIEFRDTKELTEFLKLYREQKRSKEVEATDRHRHHKRWTKRELYKLKKLIEDGRAWREVAKKLGRTEEATRCAYRRYVKKLRTHKQKIWSEAEIKKLLEMFRAGRPFEEIARELGRSESSVKTKLYRMGILGRSRITG